MLVPLEMVWLLRWSITRRRFGEGKPFDFNERARTITPRREERKLPPAPGRTPRGDRVPADEILPRK